MRICLVRLRASLGRAPVRAEAEHNAPGSGGRWFVLVPTELWVLQARILTGNRQIGLSLRTMGRLRSYSHDTQATQSVSSGWYSKRTMLASR